MMRRVLATETLWEGEMVSLRVDHATLLLLRLEGRVCAFHDRCAHLGVKLSEGRLQGHRLTCRAHGWCYDARSGEGVNPAGVALRPVRVEERDGSVFIDLESNDE
jgi:toluene monooxygenase system ferredoxin subunit